MREWLTSFFSDLAAADTLYFDRTDVRARDKVPSHESTPRPPRSLPVRAESAARDRAALERRLVELGL